jgi:hypothetical protein
VARFLDEITHGSRVLLREPALRQALALGFAEATAGAAAILELLTRAAFSPPQIKFSRKEMVHVNRWHG